jgi:hypothetical protein
VTPVNHIWLKFNEMIIENIQYWLWTGVALQQSMIISSHYSCTESNHVTSAIGYVFIRAATSKNVYVCNGYIQEGVCGGCLCAVCNLQSAMSNVMVVSDFRMPETVLDAIMAVPLEQVSRSRHAAMVATLPEAMVRSMTPYTAPLYVGPHLKSVPLAANNLMVEKYDRKCAAKHPMAWHSDMSMDLEPGSAIGIWAMGSGCSLHVKHKARDEEQVVPLAQDTLVSFSTEFNSTHVHRLCFENDARAEPSVIIVTFRVSSCVLTHMDVDCIVGDADRIRDFRHSRKQENLVVGPYTYPVGMARWSLSPGDSLEPMPLPSSRRVTCGTKPSGVGTGVLCDDTLPPT